jgi:hypothetical protein
MIINKDINPQREIYHLGALVLEILTNNTDTEFDFFDIFQRLNEKVKVSINLYIFTLDWLFILGLITKKQKTIIKCF